MIPSVKRRRRSNLLSLMRLCAFVTSLDLILHIIRRAILFDYTLIIQWKVLILKYLRFQSYVQLTLVWRSLELEIVFLRKYVFVLNLAKDLNILSKQCGSSSYTKELSYGFSNLYISATWCCVSWYFKPWILFDQTIFINYT